MLTGFSIAVQNIDSLIRVVHPSSVAVTRVIIQDATAEGGGWRVDHILCRNLRQWSHRICLFKEERG